MNILELSEQEIIRRNSLNELRAMGIDPYPAAEYVTNAFSVSRALYSAPKWAKSVFTQRS